MAIINKDISSAIHILREGGLVAIPTETVYGLAGNAQDVSAVLSIFEAKKRPSFDPLIIHSTREKIFQWVKDIPDAAYQLADAFWPGPLTLVLPKTACIPFEVTSGLDTVGIRVPRHPLTLELLECIDFPLAAPSANPFGYISPTTAQHVQDQLGDAIPMILDGGACQIGIESTIIGFEGSQPCLYRLGGIAIESIEAVIGRVELKVNMASDPRAPGQLKSHYAPRKPLLIRKEIRLEEDHPETAYLLFSSIIPGIPPERQFLLSEKGDLFVAAARVYAQLRALDQSPYQRIIACLLPEHGLGPAINDRLLRASVQGEQ
jgi:L-threonylcarbamoyladenylate synthase